MGTGTRFSLEFLGQLFMVLRICHGISPACLYRPYPGMVIFKDLFPLYQLDQGNDKEMYVQINMMHVQTCFSQ